MTAPLSQLICTGILIILPICIIWPVILWPNHEIHWNKKKKEKQNNKQAPSVMRLDYCCTVLFEMIISDYVTNKIGVKGNKNRLITEIKLCRCIYGHHSPWLCFFYFYFSFLFFVFLVSAYLKRIINSSTSFFFIFSLCGALHWHFNFFQYFNGKCVQIVNDNIIELMVCMSKWVSECSVLKIFILFLLILFPS